MKNKRILIVGAGPGGLASAMLLAHQGFDVQVFEQQAEVGGRTGGLRADGYTFDVGSTLLMMKFVLDELFARVGRRTSDYLRCVRLDPMYRLELGDERIDVSDDPAQMRAEIARRFPGSEPGLDRYLAREQRRFARIYPCLRSDFSRLGEMFSGKLLRALPHLGLTRSLYATAADCFAPDLLRLAFSFQSAYLGMSPWDCPAGFAMVSYVEHAYGVWYVQGGLNRIGQALRTVIEEEGGRVHTCTPVRRVLTERGRCVGVELPDGSRVDGDEVIINADFAHAAHALFDEAALPRRTRPRLRAMDYSCSTFMMYLGLDKLYRTPHHRFLFSRHFRDEMGAIFRRGSLADDLSLYLCNPSVTDPTMAPAGHSALYVLALTPNLKVGRVDWARDRGAVRERVLDLLETRAGLRGLRRHIRHETVCTPQDWRDRLNVFHGAAFSFSHVASQLLWFRPHARIDGLANAYMVGGGTSPGSGLPTILESGRIASDLICAQYGIAVEPLCAPPAVDEGRVGQAAPALLPMVTR